MTADQIDRSKRAKQAETEIKFSAAKEIREILDRAKEKYNEANADADAWDEDGAEPTILSIVTDDE